ncbi:uncharacterized protein LOC115680909 isoform X2 [Syzygium oleosum]|uniref:uncharacterized protein LOC115680909 isoform X2 n=1 Tax=Syzygium oleosum TaxID=219896 RepID=UPI0024BAA116|nr:uncharacterized protein LOC115680909 isoform X2 [Syzygium oleosum]
MRRLFAFVGPVGLLLGSSRSYSRVIPNVPEFNCRGISSFSHKGQSTFVLTRASALTLQEKKNAEFLTFSNWARFMTTQVKAPPQARQMGALQVTMLSPGIVYEPYALREPIPFWKRYFFLSYADFDLLSLRWFTRSGWRRTKDDIILELKSAYAIAKLRKSGYSKKEFYEEAIKLYKEINFLLAHGDKKSLRKAVTEKMYSTLKNDIKMRESMWHKVYWELIEPVVKIRTLRARLIGVDRKDVNKVFIQLTLEFMTKQKFEAYDSNGNVVAGDKNKEVLVRDIWVFEKSLFHRGSYWRLCGKIVL